LDYIDFVRIQTAILYYHSLFGNGSTEAGRPTDRTLRDPEMLVQGVLNAQGRYAYTFKNDSGYSLSLVLPDHSYTLFVRDPPLSYTHDDPSIYIDFYGGNAELDKTTPGLVIFIPGGAGD
jgi:hypothetical protein